MGLLEFFRREPEPETPDQVRDALISAFRRKKRKRLSALCEAHELTIREHFPDWTTVPKEVRSDPAKTESYVHTLITVAEAFKNAGIPELMQGLMGDEESNPLLTWGDDLAEAQKLIDADEYIHAIELLTERLKKHEGHDGPGMEFFLPRTHGMIGIAHFHLKKLAKARYHTDLALKICEENGDADGIATYQENLQQMMG